MTAGPVPRSFTAFFPDVLFWCLRCCSVWSPKKNNCFGKKCSGWLCFLPSNVFTLTGDWAFKKKKKKNFFIVFQTKARWQGLEKLSNFHPLHFYDSLTPTQTTSSPRSDPLQVSKGNNDKWYHHPLTIIIKHWIPSFTPYPDHPHLIHLVLWYLNSTHFSNFRNHLSPCHHPLWPGLALYKWIPSHQPLSSSPFHNYH